MSVPEVRLTFDERETLGVIVNRYDDEYKSLNEWEWCVTCPHRGDACPCSGRPWLGDEFTGAIEGIVAARLAAQAERVAATVEAYSPCRGGEELNADHIRYCMPFHEWQAEVAAALRGQTDA